MDCEIPILNPSIGGVVKECYEYVTLGKDRLRNYLGSKNTILHKGV